MLNIEKIKFWCMKVLPTEYDDSLSYYEVLCKIASKLNNLIDANNSQNEAINAIAEEVAKFIEVKPEEVQEAVNQWLDEHPEATTTVVDNSLTLEKFTPATQNIIKNGYLTPEMFGATGLHSYEDTIAFNKMFETAQDGDTIFIDGDGITYTLIGKIYVRKKVHVTGSPNVAIRFTGNGCFYLTGIPNTYDNTKRYYATDECRGNIANRKCYIYKCKRNIDASIDGHWNQAPANSIEGETRVWLPQDNEWWDYVGEEDVYDVRGSVNENATSVFDHILFKESSNVFRGDVRYFTVENCRFRNCERIFYFEGLYPSKPSSWFGKIDITNCEFRDCYELFYLSHTNHADTEANEGLNAVTISGGVIIDCNFFYQFADSTNPYNVNNNTRIENMYITGCDIERSSFFKAERQLTETAKERIYWYGRLFLYNVCFDGCYIEYFSFLKHAADSYPLKTSTVIFNNCYMQLYNVNLVECLETTSSPEGNFGEACFDFNLINCTMKITDSTADTLPIVVLNSTKYKFRLMGCYPQIVLIVNGVTSYAAPPDLKKIYSCANEPMIDWGMTSGSFRNSTCYSRVFSWEDAHINQYAYYPNMYTLPNLNFYSYNLLKNSPNNSFLVYHPNVTNTQREYETLMFMNTRSSKTIKNYRLCSNENLEEVIFDDAFDGQDVSTWDDYKNCPKLKYVYFRAKPSTPLRADFFANDSALVGVYMPWSESDPVNANRGSNNWGSGVMDTGTRTVWHFNHVPPEPYQG